MNEQQLIHLAADGDDASINALAQQYVPVVWRLRRQYYVRNFDEDDWASRRSNCSLSSG
ncbi:hypothetical protein T1I15_06730 [Lactiplantibacillus plantarum]|nr:hypothetical protein T1I15_06730 [Lactiplantibacillus plantarum]